MDNKLIASKLQDLGNLRLMQGANSFRANAYFKASKIIGHLDTEITDIDQLDEVNGIGAKIYSVVEELLTSGSHSELDANKQALGPVLELAMIPGVGVKTAKKFIEEGFDSIASLKEGILSGEIKRRKLLDAIAFAEMSTGGRIPREFVEQTSSNLLEKIRDLSCVEKAEFAGSMRRQKEMVKDVDLLVCARNSEDVLEEFLQHGTLIESGNSKASIFAMFNHLDFGPKQFRIDLMIVSPGTILRNPWGAALCHFTGSKEHNISLRTYGKAKGINISQNGITDSEGLWLGGENEEDLYRILGLRYIEPFDRNGPHPDLRGK